MGLIPEKNPDKSSYPLQIVIIAISNKLRNNIMIGQDAFRMNNQKGGILEEMAQ